MTLPITNVDKVHCSPAVTNVHTPCSLRLRLPTDVDGEILQAFIASPIQTRRRAFSKTLALTTLKYYERCKHSPFIDQ